MNNLESMLVVIIAITIVFLLLWSPGDESSCKKDSDCACGVHVTTGECFYGNSRFVDTTIQCPDFCTGIAGNLRVVCESNTCVQRGV